MSPLPVQPHLTPGPAPGLAGRLNALSEKAGKGDATARSELSEACQKLESLFLRWLLKEMRATVPESGLLDQSPGRETYEDLLDDALATSLARGGGFGLAKALEAQLARPASAPPPQSPHPTVRPRAETTHADAPGTGD